MAKDLIPCDRYGAIMIDEGHDFAKHNLTATTEDSENIPLIEPQTVGRHSLMPEAKLLLTTHSNTEFTTRMSNVMTYGLILREVVG